MHGTPVIVEAVRTPLGKRHGWLAGIHAAVLLGAAQVEVLKRSGIDPSLVDEVIGGCVTQAGEQSNNMVRRAWMHAGLPRQVASTVIDAQCSSAQQATHLINAMILAGVIRAGIACGVESMSRIPLGANVPPGLGDPRPTDWDIDLPNQFEGADRIVRDRGFAASRRRRLRPLVAAEGPGRSRRGPVRPRDLRGQGARARRRRVSPPARPGSSTPTRASGTRPSRRWPRSPPCSRAAPTRLVRRPRSPTASSALLLMDSDLARSLGLKPRARIVSSCLVGADPYYHLDGPVQATERLLEDTGM